MYRTSPNFLLLLSKRNKEEIGYGGALFPHVTGQKRHLSQQWPPIKVKGFHGRPLKETHKRFGTEIGEIRV